MTMIDRNVLVILVAAMLLVGITLLPEPAPLQRAGVSIPLSAGGKACLAIMAFAVLLWVSEAVSFAVTSLLVVLLVPLLQLSTYSDVVRAGFGSPIITFFIGVLMLSAAFTRSGLGTRLVYQILYRLGTRTDLVLLGVLGSGVFISSWVTDMAAAAILLPVGAGLLRDVGMRPGESNFGRAVMIATAFGPLIGGIATPAGTGANLVAIAQLRQLANVDISFTYWMSYGVPASLLMLPVCWRLLLWLFPPEVERLPIHEDEIRARLDELGPMQPVEWRTLLVFAVVITTWLSTPLLSDWTNGAIAPPVEAVALAGGLSLFFPGMRVLSWKEAAC
jgi:sodium-dependent dicarboxylate transporter 2/3/5